MMTHAAARRLRVGAGLALLACSLELVRADTHVWTGAGLTGNWSLPANWSGNNPPAVGEAAPNVIVFPNGAARLNNTNNLGGLVVDRLTFDGSGYYIQGSGVGTNLTFRGGSYNFGGYGAHTLGESLIITLSNTVSFATMPGANITIRSKLVGTGGLSTVGTGTLSLSGLQDNTYSGTTTVNEGVLALDGGYLLFNTWVSSLAVPGPLVIGGTNMSQAPYAVLIQGGQIADTAPVTINPNGTFYLGGNNETIGSLTFNGGSLRGDSLETSLIGTLTLGGNITAVYSPLANASANAKLNLGGATRTIDVQGGNLTLVGSIADGITAGRGTAGLTKIGAGWLLLGAATNTYNGATVVNAGTLEVLSNGALGTTNLGTTVANGAQLLLNQVSIGNEPLTLNGNANGAGALVGLGTNSWSGQVTLATDTTLSLNNATDQLTLFGLITGAGALIQQGVGTLILDGFVNNTYSGGTYINQGTLKADCGYFAGVYPTFTFVPQLAIPGFLQIGNVLNGATVQLLANAQLSPTGPVVINWGSKLDLQNALTSCGPLTLNNGTVQTGTGLLTLGGDLTVGPNAAGWLYGKLSLGGTTRQFNVGTGSSLLLSATVSDGGSPAGITKTGAGFINANLTNTYSGPTTINAGQISAFNPGSLGTGAGGVTINAGGLLLLASDFLAISNVTLTLNGQGSTNAQLAATASYTQWAGPILLASDSTVQSLYDNASLLLSGPISGPGGMLINGRGEVDLAGASDNTFAGTLRLSGTNFVGLGKDPGATAVPGPLVIGNANDAPGSLWLQWFNSHQVNNASPVAVNASGWMDLENCNETIGPLTVDGGSVVGGGILTLNGNFTNNLGYSVLNCPLSLGGQSRLFWMGDYVAINSSISDGGAPAGITFSGPGYGGGVLAGSNSFNGPVVIDNAILWAYDNHALGTTNGGTQLVNGGVLGLNNVTVTNESLSLSGSGTLGQSEVYLSQTNSWSGPIQLQSDCSFNAHDTDSVFTVSAPIGGPGALNLMGNGVIRLTGTANNTLTGPVNSVVQLLELAKTNAVAVSSSLFLTAGTARYRNSHQVADTCPVTVAANNLASATLDLNGFVDTIGDLTGSGTILLGAGTLSVGGTNAINLFQGTIVGSGGSLVKTNANTLLLTGNNTYSGNTLVQGGTLFVAGQQPASDVYVNTNAMLQGGGTVGRLTVNAGGAVMPGDLFSTAKLNCANVLFNTGSTLKVKLQGPNPGTGYDQLNVIGTVTLGAGVNLVVTKTIAGSTNQQFVIINNDGAEAPMGTFLGLANSATFTASGSQLRINYGDTFSNDILLTELTRPPSPKFNSLTQVAGGLQLLGTGTPGLAFVVQANTNLATATWTSLGNATANTLGTVAFTDAQAKNYPQRFYRLLLP